MENMENDDVYVNVINLTNLDFAVGAYKYYEGKGYSEENFNELTKDDIRSDITEIRSIIYSHSDFFVEEKNKKGMVSSYPARGTDFGGFDDPFEVIDTIGYEDGYSNINYHMYDDRSDMFICSKVIEWIGEREDLQDTLEQATLTHSADFYISDLVDYYKKENISLDEMPEEIIDAFKNGDYEKYKNDENKETYSAIQSHIDKKILEKEIEINVNAPSVKKARL
ncbi:hypothetical protein [Buttiauxella gaviniae]|uniref:hypothetical protein n=1 Tax=Buttiauxella gaviniae TaxID=82990 RepID=UPI0039B0ECA6